MLRVARMYVSTAAVAEEVVQETWLGVLRGLHSFEGRSSLRTWIFRILTNIAKTRGQREGRSLPVRLARRRRPRRTGRRSEPIRLRRRVVARARGRRCPTTGPGSRRTGSSVTRRSTVIGRAIAALPPMQAEVIRLRDALGWTSEEVRNALDLTETNQRVLLHRARAKVRGALERYLSSEAT